MQIAQLEQRRSAPDRAKPWMEMIQAQARLVIDQDGPLVTITDNAGTVRRYTTNTKPEKHQLTSGTVETKAR